MKERITIGKGPGIQKKRECGENSKYWNDDIESLNIYDLFWKIEFFWFWVNLLGKLNAVWKDLLAKILVLNVFDIWINKIQKRHYATRKEWERTLGCFCNCSTLIKRIKIKSQVTSRSFCFKTMQISLKSN